MKFIAAHKVMFTVGLLLAAGAAWYLHKRATAGTSAPAASGAASPDYGGVATDPYNDSAAPQFSFDLGSLLPPGPAAPVSPSGGGSPDGTPPPGKVATPIVHWPVGTPGGGSVPIPTKPIEVPPGVPRVPGPPVHIQEPILTLGGGGTGSPKPIVSLPIKKPTPVAY
jgi:hypothetical protein